METHFTEKDRATLTKVEVKLDRAIEDIASLNNNFATKKDLDTVISDVRDLEDNQRWIIRIILGIIVAAVITLLINSK